MKEIKPGTVHIESFFPGPQHLASALGNPNVDVVATTAVILFFEAASHNLASPYFEPGEISVGTHVNVDHLAPANASQPIKVTATLDKQLGRRLEFGLTAQQGQTVVMSGRHYRAVMSAERFGETHREPDRGPVGIDFWFDFHSPWCYFACHRIGGIAREFGAALHWRPVHLANLMTAVDGRRPLEENERFVAWYKQDQQDAADLLGLPFAPHPDYPKRPSRALRAAIFAQENGVQEAFVQTLMRGYWSQQKDISDLSWLRSVGESVGLDGDAVMNATSAPEYKEKLNRNLDLAVEQDVFGLPASVVNGKIFFGNDRLELLRHCLSGRQPKLKTRRPTR